MPLTEVIYNSHTGVITTLPTPIAEVQLRLGIGWHGPFQSVREAVDYFHANKSKNPGWKEPTGNVGQALENAGSSAVSEVKEAVTGDIADKFGAWFLRIGEVLLGLVLIGVGLAKLTGIENVVSKVAKVV